MKNIIQKIPCRWCLCTFSAQFMVALSLLWLVAGLGSALASNLLTNPGFEDGSTYWSPSVLRGGTGSVVTDAGGAHSGSNYYSATGPASGWASVAQGDTRGGYSTGVTTMTVNPANYYKLSAWVKVPGASVTPQPVTLRYRFEPSTNRTDVGTKTINTEDWTYLETPLIQSGATDTFMSYYEVHSLNNGITMYVDDCTLTEYVPMTLQGRVVNGAGAGVDGASVAASSAAYSSSATTTSGGGYYTLAVPAGTYSVGASTAGFKGTTSATISTSPTTATNIVLSVDPDYDADLLFSLRASSASATGPWPCAYPTGSSLARMGSPGVETIASQQWEKNMYSPSSDGYRFGTYASPIPVNGASVVAVVKPQYRVDGGWGCVFNAFYNDLMLNVNQTNGQINVVRKNVWYNGPILQSGQEAVLTVVVQPDGQFKLYVNGTEALSVTTPSAYLQMTPGGWNGSVLGNYSFGNSINVGRNDPDGWSSYNGDIGDVYVYKTAIDTAKRGALEVALGAKFGIAVVAPPLPATISGNVAEYSTGVSGVVVTATPGSGLTATTDGNGDYEISGALSGVTYSLSLSSLPAATMIDTAPPAFSAAVGANTGMNFTLKSNGAEQFPVGTVAYWPFDNTLSDPIGGNTLVAAAGTVAFGPGNFGGAAFYCNGSTYLKTLTSQLPTGVPTGSNPYTVAAWVKADTGCPGSATWVAYGSTNGSQANTFRFDGGNNPNWNNVWNYWWGNDFGGTLPSGNFFDGWHSVVGTWDGTTETLYLDGVQRAQRNPSQPNISGNNFFIGRALFDGDYFKGWIDDVLIMDRAMNQAEATAYNTFGARSIGTASDIAATVSGASGGSISPSGIVPVLNGATRTFTMTPAFDYSVSDVTVTENGVTTSKGAVTTYTFTDVQQAGDITVTFSQPPPQIISGRVTDGASGIANAKVYFSTSSPAVASPIHTTTTDANGYYSVTLEQLSWHVMAFALGYDYSADSSFSVSGSPATQPDIALTANANWDLLFALSVDSLGGKAASSPTGNRAADYPVGGNLIAINTPTVVAVDLDGTNTINWEQNNYSTGTGYRFVAPDQAGIVVGGQYQTPIVSNGVSAVAVVQPNYIGAGGEPRGEIVDLFYNELFLAISHQSASEGNVIIDWRDYHAIDTGYKVPNGQKTILSLVVQPNGAIKLFANGDLKWSLKLGDSTPWGPFTGVDYTTLRPLTWAKTIAVGRNDFDGWSTFSGNIGDVYVYKSAISDAKRAALESSLGTKFGIAVTTSVLDYNSWASTNAGGQSASEDYNGDGVANGIAFFMGMDGRATNPGVVNGKVTWPHVNAVSSFAVEVSGNLQDWTLANPADIDTSDPTKVVFTLTPGVATKFCRLVVVP